MASIDPSIGSANNEQLAILALQIAQGQVGQSEQPKGSNSGPMVNEYLKSVGLKPGYAWCQAFVYWCYETAAEQLNLVNPVLRTAGVHDCWNRSSTGHVPGSNRNKIAKAEAILKPQALRPGCQFILSFDGAAGHTGIVEKTEGNVPYTIEGNSNNNGSREGYEVVRHKRNLNDKSLTGFIVYTTGN